MRYLWRWLRSLAFVGQMYLMLMVIALAFMPAAMINIRYAYMGIRTYCRWVRWTAHWMVGLRSEVRGTVPTDEVMIASKHQSFFDIIILCSVVPRPKFIMKRQLVNTPFLGWYARRIGCIPVDRGKRGAAIQTMLQDAANGEGTPGQLIIYPQGTRTAPGATLPYKIGTGALYSQLNQTCVPAATNVGVFWPRRGIYRKPGLAVIEFLPPIPPGTEIKPFMATLQDQVETASNRLMRDAGFALPSDTASHPSTP